MHTRILTTCFLFLFSQAVHADLSVRECIKNSTGGRWELPGDNAWHTVLTLEFNNQTVSDIVAQATVVYHEGPGQTGARVDYQLVLDGSTSFIMQHRPHTGYPTAKILRAVFPDVGADEHILEIRARNRSTFSAYFSLAWLGPLLVEGSELTSTGSQTTSITTPSTNTWTTLVSTSITPAAGKAIILGAYSAVSAGPLNQPIEYRILRNNTTTVGTFFDSVSSHLPSGQSFAVLDRSPGTGAITYTLQARTIGGATTFSSRQFLAQTVPGNLTVYEGTASNLTFPADANWHVIASSGPTVLSPASTGSQGTRGFGFATVTYNGAYNNEALLRFNFIANQPWEVGVVHVHGTGGKTVMEGLMSDWERLGFTSGNSYSVELVGFGQCPSASSLSVKSARFQILVLPDNEGLVTPAACVNVPSTCCANAPSCTVYTCTPGLNVVSGPGTDCPIPQ